MPVFRVLLHSIPERTLETDFLGYLTRELRSAALSLLTTREPFIMK